ncbi:hypothetical protein GFJ94_07680 [Flavobacterium sp. LMO8]|uniref:hypothetical protein n=1 Tax=Flavobacterium sp. LMO8 TaxID=2654244 RepID=UPI001291F6C2|nr:hypothetical protein [Flavobacterium sp. LMO8]MQP24941.1 hypothetical protein [Flavobacterium sp. LMO8]
MKKITLLFFLFTIGISAQTGKIKYYLDPEGREISKEEKIFLIDKYPDNSLSFRKTKDSGYVYQFNAPKYSTYKVDYKIIKTEIEKITNKTYSDSTIFLIRFNYLDDTCSDWHSNEMNIEKINSIKNFDDSLKRKIERKSNVIYLCLFENRIILKNRPKSKNEYFFSDKNNFFRNNLFLHPTVCGSFGLIKPNGQTLIRNGEYRPDSMHEHLKPEIWNLIFQQ